MKPAGSCKKNFYQINFMRPSEFILVVIFTHTHHYYLNRFVDYSTAVTLIHVGMVFSAYE
jgi:hypothetical protein